MFQRGVVRQAGLSNGKMTRRQKKTKKQSETKERLLNEEEEEGEVVQIKIKLG